MSARIGRNKFSEMELKRIKEMISLGIAVTVIAKRFGCSVNPITLIKRSMK